MPEQEMHTTAFWLHFSAKFLGSLEQYTPTERQHGLAGLGNAFQTVASLLLMCDPRDLGVALTEDIAGSVSLWEPNLYLYDSYSGGVGLSAPLYRLSARLFTQTAELIGGCGCEAGCPACVGPTGEIGETGKKVAAEILSRLIHSDQDAADQDAHSKVLESMPVLLPAEISLQSSPEN